MKLAVSLDRETNQVTIQGRMEGPVLGDFRRELGPEDAFLGHAHEFWKEHLGLVEVDEKGKVLV